MAKTLLCCLIVQSMMTLGSAECQPNFIERNGWNGQVICCKSLKEKCPTGTSLKECEYHGGKDECTPDHFSHSVSDGNNSYNHHPSSNANKTGNFKVESSSLKVKRLVITIAVIIVITVVIVIIVIFGQRKCSKATRQKEASLPEIIIEKNMENSTVELLSDSGISLASVVTGDLSDTSSREPMLNNVRENDSIC